MGEGVECGEYSAGDDLVKALDQMIDLFGWMDVRTAIESSLNIAFWHAWSRNLV